MENYINLKIMDKDIVKISPQLAKLLGYDKTNEFSSEIVEVEFKRIIREILKDDNSVIKSSFLEVTTEDEIDKAVPIALKKHYEEYRKYEAYFENNQNHILKLDKEIAGAFKYAICCTEKSNDICIDMNVFETCIVLTNQNFFDECMYEANHGIEHYRFFNSVKRKTRKFFRKYPVSILSN